MMTATNAADVHVPENRDHVIRIFSRVMEEDQRDLKRRKDQDYGKHPVTTSQTFSSWTWEQVRERLNISVFGLDTFVAPMVPLDDAQLTNAVDALSRQLAAKATGFGPLGNAPNDATRAYFVAEILLSVTSRFHDQNLRWFCESMHHCQC
jgi:hypothetical protein